MNNDSTAFDEFDSRKLSAEDLAILQAFEAMDIWPAERQGDAPAIYTPSSFSPLGDQEMFLIFTAEAEEDIALIRQVIKQFEQQGAENSVGFTALKRAGHKLHGTAGAVGFPLISIIAGHIELLAENVCNQTITSSMGFDALLASTTALEHCLDIVLSTNKEPDADATLADLEEIYRHLHLDFHLLEQKSSTGVLKKITTEELTCIPMETFMSGYTTRDENNFSGEKYCQAPSEMEKCVRSAPLPPFEEFQQTSPLSASLPTQRFDPRRIEHLMSQTEKLIEQRATVEEAQAQLVCALQELYIAQTQLQRLEPLIARLQVEHKITPSFSAPVPNSSLIARILHQSSPTHQRVEYQQGEGAQVNWQQTQGQTGWDELEMERFNEQDLFWHTLKDTIASITITSANLRSAFTRFSTVQQNYLACVTNVRNGTLRLRQAPFSTIVPRLRRVVDLSALAQTQQKADFQVTGEEIEIDQDILDVLSTPLVQFLRTCLADLALDDASTTGKQEHTSPRVWLNVTHYGDRLLLEISFSMPISGGAIETIRAPIVQQLRGTISLQRNSAGGISFFLRIPHPHNSIFCLLVRAGDQHFLIPFDRIEYISNEQEKKVTTHYQLQTLLGYQSPITTSPLEPIIRPLLVLAAEVDGIDRAAIIVDEIVSDQECIVKPLPSYLQRPGIIGVTIDGKGRVLLVVDLHSLIRSAPQYNTLVRPHKRSQPHKDKIIVIDDSAALRYSLVQTLRQANYTVYESCDGFAALESLRRHRPDLCLLDIEMPNLNGFDLLRLMRGNPVLSGIKVIMLTSRNAAKHIQYALELGANAYLTKPCPQEDLFQTIERVLQE
jgi:chemosensory pili system protein ChpA (sensor histidine kinase/response regulator)